MKNVLRISTAFIAVIAFSGCGAIQQAERLFDTQEAGDGIECESPADEMIDGVCSPSGAVPTTGGPPATSPVEPSCESPLDLYDPVTATCHP